MNTTPVPILFASIFLAIQPIALALDLQLPDGAVYEDAKVREVIGAEVLIEHSGGIKRLQIVNIPRETRTVLGLKPTLSTARAEFAASITALRAPFERLSDAYQNRLTTLEDSAKSEGLLEALLEIRKEIEEFQSNSETREFSHEPLAKARAIYDREFEKLQDSSLSKLTATLVNHRDELDGILRDLTRNDLIQEATNAKEEQEKTIAMISDPSLALTQFGIGVERNQPTNPLDSHGGAPAQALSRMVIVPVVEGGLAVPDSYAAIEAADIADFVATGVTEYPNAGAIRSNGTIVFWENGSQEPIIIGGQNVAMYHGFEIPVIGLDRSGTLNIGGTAPESLTIALSNQSDVESVSTTSGAAAIIAKETGKLSIFGRPDHKNVSILSSFDNVVSVEFTGMAFATVLQKDGTVSKLFNGAVSEAPTPVKIVELLTGAIGKTESGELVSLGNVPEIIANVGNNPRQLFFRGGLLSAIDEEGGFHCYYQNDSKQWIQHPAVEKALHGCVSFGPIIVGKARFIVALLPAKTVPRSGLWDPAKLTEARK